MEPIEALLKTIQKHETLIKQLHISETLLKTVENQCAPYILV